MPLTTYTPGEVLTAASLNDNFTFAASNPPGGLELISTTAIGTTVSSVTVSGAFSATYDNYFVTIDGTVGSTASYTGLALGATTTGYYNASLYAAYNTGTVLSQNSSNGAKFVNIGEQAH